MVELEWDPQKEQLNLRKHAVSFHEAASVFSDPLSLTIPDPDHSEDEKRLLILGRSAAGKLLVVAHTDRGDRIRIISARTASSREARDYESGR